MPAPLIYLGQQGNSNNGCSMVIEAPFVFKNFLLISWEGASLAMAVNARAPAVYDTATGDMILNQNKMLSYNYNVTIHVPGVKINHCI